MSQGLTYKESGVDIKEAAALVGDIGALRQRTEKNRHLHQAFGLFAASYDLSSYKEPVIVTGCDGVGTKMELCLEHDQLETAGKDLVAMNVNDILTTGGDPLLFLDYIGIGRIDKSQITRIIAGMVEWLEACNCILAGGETAEMPGMYASGEYDLAGFAVGVVEKSAIVDGRGIAAGDVVLGLASSGAHSNGFSLIRRIVDASGADLAAPFAGSTLGAALMAPTRIYVKPVLALMHELPVKGIAHITGGGLVENIPRCLPEGTMAVLDQRSWPQPEIFGWLQREGGVADAEMHRTFNCGIGFVLIVAAGDAARAEQVLRDGGQSVHRIGRIEAQVAGEARTQVR